MDQLICASLSHIHYWYEVGMLKVMSSLMIVNTLPSQVNQAQKMGHESTVEISSLSVD